MKNKSGATAESVVVVNKQMPWVGLSWGRWTLVVPGRDYALESTQTHTHARTRFTQVQGPREEVKPLLLLV